MNQLDGTGREKRSLTARLALLACTTPKPDKLRGAMVLGGQVKPPAAYPIQRPETQVAQSRRTAVPRILAHHQGRSCFVAEGWRTRFSALNPGPGASNAQPVMDPTRKQGHQAAFPLPVRRS